MQFPNFFSMDNPKAIKAQKMGWLNAINYMAPHRLAGVGDLCGDASKGCIALCLGQHSGYAALYPRVIQSRIRKAKWFMRDRKAFMLEMFQHICRAQYAARKAKLQLCVRLNGSTDLAWDAIKSPAQGMTIIEMFPTVQFVDYTKSKKRMLAFCAGKFPPNYHLTFSRSETNEADCHEVLAAGGNVVVVFSKELKKDYVDITRWQGWTVIDGDLSDLRHLDPVKGAIIALSPKGSKAKRDQSGFVVR